jgi:cytochrome c-type biogenesis protein CcmF
MVGSSFWTTTASAWLEEKKQTELGAYHFTFDQITAIKGPNYNSDQATITITKNDQTVATVYPEKRWYPVAEKDTTEVAIRPVGAGDIYIALGTEQPDHPGRWLVRFYHHPLVNLLWLGVICMLSGGAFALVSYAQKIKRETVI